MKIEAFIANRYLSTTRHSFSVSLLKWIGMLGIALGVLCLMVVISVMRGFEKNFEEKILGFQAPLILEATAAHADQLPKVEELKHIYPELNYVEKRIEGELVIESSFGTSSGARVRGVDRSVNEIKGLGRLLIAEDIDDPLHPKPTPDGEALPGIILGTELAAILQVHPDFKDDVKLVFPFGDISPTGEVLPRIRRFRVTGLFNSGFYEYDSKFAIVSKEMAERMFGEYGRYSLAVYLDDVSDSIVRLYSEVIKKSLKETYEQPAWTASTWRERNQRLFQALLLERLGMMVLLLMIVLIATFNIFALLSMIVMEKVKDMAVLRTVGLRLNQVRRVFLWQVFKIGLRGTSIGGTFGIIICLWLYIFPYELPPSYYITHLPVTFDPIYIFLILIAGPVISLLAGLYPAYQSCKPVIAEVLRYE